VKCSDGLNNNELNQYDSRAHHEAHDMLVLLDMKIENEGLQRLYLFHYNLSPGFSFKSHWKEGFKNSSKKFII